MNTSLLPNPVPTVVHRLGAIDAHRGFIMIVMAIDHAAALVARQHPGENWYEPLQTPTDPVAFLTRFLTHICAPGFFLLMGVGIYFLVQHRLKQGWSEGRITLHLAIRGGILLLVNQLLENPAWLMGFSFAAPEDTGGIETPPGLFIPLGVITALGLSMILMSVLRKVPAIGQVALGVGMMIFSQWILPPMSAGGDAFSYWQRVLTTPGFTPPLFVIYPLLPWLGVAMIGFAVGRGLDRSRARMFKAALPLGLGLLALWFVIRWTGGFGNSFPYTEGSWMVFMNMVKYPPSIAYLSWTLGLNFLIMWAMSRWGNALASTHPLMVFGRTALFFYVIHLYVYALVGAAFPHGASFGVMYLVWALGLVPLYFACKAYGRFKRSTKPGSIWRMF